jgi:hypothetical protein
MALAEHESVLRRVQVRSKQGGEQINARETRANVARLRTEMDLQELAPNREGGLR